MSANTKTRKKPAAVPQTIRSADGKPAFAVLPWKEYQALLDAAEDASDSTHAATLGRRIDTGEEEVFPAALVARLTGGNSPLKVFREFRGLTQRDLASAVGVNQGFLSELETGAKTASVKTLRALARCLRVDVELLLPDEASNN